MLGMAGYGAKIPILGDLPSEILYLVCVLVCMNEMLFKCDARERCSTQISSRSKIFSGWATDFSI